MTTPFNPYHSPHTQSQAPLPPGEPGKYAPCPRCGVSHAKKLGFTWWGGALGPSMFTHVKCGSCGMKYNGKTGQSNAAAITIYVVVSTVIVLGLLFALRGFLP
jgi:hypothetical protein